MSVSEEPLGSVLINGRYRVLHPLQEGGFGQTFLVEDTQLPSQRRCVLKHLKPVQHNPEFYKLVQERFQREAVTQETLGEICQQIPRLYAYFSEGDHFYLVEEWIDGETLSAKVAEVGRFSEAAVRDILNQLLLTIETVHQHQIIHRDIKPDNIILRRRDGHPVLIDFGAVKESMGAIVTSQGVTGRSIVIGTAGYMAPEQSAGRPLYASDLYSLGLTAIYLLTGKSPAELNTDPHSGQLDWRSQASPVSEDLAQVINTAIQMHPQNRFEDAKTMLQNLQTVPINAPIDGPTLISRPQSVNRTPQPFIPQPQISQPQILQARSANAATPIFQPETIANTQVVSPAAGSNSAAHLPNSARNDWIKAALIGGGIGGGLLTGLLLLRGQTPVVIVQSSPSTAASISPSVSPSVQPSASNAQNSPSLEPSPEPSTEPSLTASPTCGDSGGNGQSWYPVFINNADVEQVRRQYCRDAIAKIRDNGTPTVQVASFTDQQRATDFAQKVGGEVGRPYQVGSSPSPQPAKPDNDPEATTNAVIIGNRGKTNIRRGPGTVYGVQHFAYPGDRVKILDSGQDSGGYIWYKVYFPKSGASGWIAGQLLQPD